MNYRFFYVIFLVIYIIKTFLFSSDPNIFLVKHTMHLFFSVFDLIDISKNSRISVKDGKFSNFVNCSKLLSQCQKYYIQRINWVAFYSVSKFNVSVFCFYLPLSIYQQNSRKFSEKMKIFNFWSNFLRYYAK